MSGHSFVFFFFVFFFFVFSHTCKNCYKTKTRAPIALKFGTQKGSPKAHPSIKFGANPMNGSGVMTDYSRKTRSICCHAYRVNRFMDWAENCYVDGVTIVGVPFGSLKGIEIKTTEIWHKIQPVSQLRDRFLVIKKYSFLRLLGKPLRAMSWKSVYSWNKLHRKSLQ